MSEDKTLIYDFGFSFANEEDLDAYQRAQDAQNELKGVSEEAAVYKKRLDNLYNAFAPLLNNLKRDPQRDYILWPDRLNKIEAFEDMLQEIYQGR